MTDKTDHADLLHALLDTHRGSDLIMSALMHGAVSEALEVAMSASESYIRFLIKFTATVDVGDVGLLEAQAAHCKLVSTAVKFRIGMGQCNDC